MLFSIIIPAYNAENTLRETLDSAINQSFDDYEIVLVNDGSTDKTEKICNELYGSNPHFNYIKQNNKGVYEARRTGAKQSKGDYLIFVDADDRLRPDSLSILASHITSHDPDIICFRYTRNEDYTNDPLLSSPLTPAFYNGDTLKRVRECLAQGRLTSIWGKAIKKKCINRSLASNQSKRIDFAEDLLQIIPIIEDAESLLQIDEILYFYNVENSRSATHNYKEKQLRDLTYVTATLIQNVAHWGNTIKKESLRMRTSQYLYLLQINELTSPADQKKENFLAISKELFDIEDEALPPRGGYRPDSQLLFLAAKFSNYSLSRFVIQTSEIAKKAICTIIKYAPLK